MKTRYATTKKFSSKATSHQIRDLNGRLSTTTEEQQLLNRPPPMDHITPVLQELHWLHVRNRIHFKILLLTFKALNGLAPAYISDLINLRKHARHSLRFNSEIYSITSSKENEKIFW